MKRRDSLFVLLMVGLFNCNDKAGLPASASNPSSSSTETQVEERKKSDLITQEGNENQQPVKFSAQYELLTSAGRLFLGVRKKENQAVYFALSAQDNDTVRGAATLVLVEDTRGVFLVPEGTPIWDDVKKEEYVCDSTYAFDAGQLQVSIAFEKGSRQRVSLVVYNSTHDVIKDGLYTLYRIVK